MRIPDHPQKGRMLWLVGQHHTKPVVAREHFAAGLRAERAIRDR
jgi:hypothetical protein